MHTSTRLILTALAVSLVSYAQLAPSRPIGEANPQQPAQRPIGEANPQQPQQPGAPSPAAQNAPESNAPRLAPNGGMMLDNVSLVDFISIIAKQLKLNYVLDPGVAGRVSVFTYGEIKPVDL